MSIELPSTCAETSKYICLKFSFQQIEPRPTEAEIDQLIENQFGIINLAGEEEAICIKQNRAECRVAGLCVSVARFLNPRMANLAE
jgi:hypothetical protein